MRISSKKDLNRLLDFYQLVIRETDGISVHACWDFEKHPTAGSITEYVEQGAMYILEEGQDIIAAAAVTHYQPEEYHDVNWQAELKDGEVAAVHILAVDPRVQNRGCAKKFMREIIEYERSKGMKAVRLDTLKCNTPAQRLYGSFGFSHRGVHRWYAENTGWYDFYLYEYLL